MRRVVAAGLASVALVACATPTAPSTPPATEAQAARYPTATATATLSPPVATRAELESLMLAARGKVLVIHVWATWCPPCVEELPRIVQLEREWRGQDVVLLSLAADPAINEAGVARFAAAHGAEFPTRIVTAPAEDVAAAVGAPSWTGALPSTFVFDRRGRKRFETFRQTEADVLRRAVAGARSGR